MTLILKAYLFMNLLLILIVVAIQKHLKLKKFFQVLKVVFVKKKQE
jgi:hypothetical protein